MQRTLSAEIAAVIVPDLGSVPPAEEIDNWRRW